MFCGSVISAFNQENKRADFLSLKPVNKPNLYILSKTAKAESLRQKEVNG